MKWYSIFFVCGMVSFAYANEHHRPESETTSATVDITRKNGQVDSITLRTADYLDIMRQQGKIDEAQAVLLRFLNQATTPEIKAEMAYYLGLIAFETEQYDQAETYYRQALQYMPNYVWAQLELAGTLFVLGKYEASRHYFEQVQQNTADAQMLQSVQAYLQRIAEQRTFDYTFNVGVYPNDNVNNAPQVDTYQFFGRTVTPSERPKSAVGISYNASVYYKKRGRDNDIYTLTLAPTGIKYQDGQYDTTKITVSLSRKNQLKQGYTQQKIHVAQSFYGGHKSTKNKGVSYTRGWYVTPKTVLSLTGDWGHTHLIEDNYDVFKTALVPSIRYFISDTQSVAVTLNRTRTAHDLTYRKGTQLGGDITYSRTLKNGIGVSPNISYNRFVSDTEQAGLGGIRIRETTAFNIKITLSPYEIFQFIPTITLGTSRIDSTIKMDRAKNNTFMVVFDRKF